MESNQSFEDYEMNGSLTELKEKYNEGVKKQAELEKKVEYAKFIATNTSADKKIKNNHKKELEQYKKIRKIDLTKSLNGRRYSMKLEKLIRTKEIVGTIDEWIKDLHCCYLNCSIDAKMKFLIENTDQIYCEHHAPLTENSIECINLGEELKQNNAMMNKFEKQLLTIQKLVALVRSYMEYIDPDSQIGKRNKELENKYEDLKNTLNSIYERVMHIINKARAETMKKEKKNYESFSFIQFECKRSTTILFEIESMVNGMLRDLQADSLIQLMLDANKNAEPDISKEAQLDEEFKVEQYSTVPDEIYGKVYHLIDLSVQSESIIKKFENKIKTIIDIFEARNKNMDQITERFSQVYPVLQEILIKHQDQLQAVKNEQEELQQKIDEKEKEILKQLTLRDKQFYIHKLKWDELRAELFKRLFTESSKIYKRLGQFDYGQPNCTTHHINTCFDKEDEYDRYWIYIGEVKEGTDDTPHGIGIRVSKWGDIEEGYWKDGEQHGRGRYIWNSGGCGYYIGEYKEGRFNGEGTYYKANGDKYEGGWKGGRKYGQGTYYTKDGHKYTGQWDDYKGQGEVNYKDGNKYIGHWDYDYDNDSLKRHGLGTLYSADGQVLNQGK